MSIRERIFAAGLMAGLLVLGLTGGAAFVQERRLLTMQQLAEVESRREQLLDDFESHLRNLRREGFNYALVGDEASLDDFHRAAAAVDSISTSLAAQPDILGGRDRLDALLVTVEHYVNAYQRIVRTAETEGNEAALRQAGEVVRAERLDQILANLHQFERDNIVAFAERNTQITEAARAAILAIGLFVVLGLALIVVSVAMMLRYYAANKTLLAEMTSLNKKLEAGRREMESIVSFVSHDLRAPLINVKGFSDALSADARRLAGLIENAALPSETQARCSEIVHRDLPESLEFIRSAADSMDRLITTMVQVARAGQLPVHPQRIDVTAMAQAIVKDFEFRIKETGATVQIDSMPDCIADADQVRQVFANLIDNAIKYRQPSRPLHVRVMGTTEAGHSVYCVEDNGLGMHARDLESIFEMYHRVKEGQTEGHGLGLAIARKMVERNGGTLEVRSEPNRGSRFFVRLKTAGEKTTR